LGLHTLAASNGNPGELGGHPPNGAVAWRTCGLLVVTPVFKLGTTGTTSGVQRLGDSSIAIPAQTDDPYISTYICVKESAASSMIQRLVLLRARLGAVPRDEAVTKR